MSHRAAGPGKLLEGPKQVPQHQLSQATDTSTAEEATAKSMVQCQRGSMGKESFWRQLGRGPGFTGQQPGQAHAPGDGLQDWQRQAPSHPLVQATPPGSCRGAGGPLQWSQPRVSWEHVPRQTQTDVKVRKLPSKGGAGTQQEETGGQGHSTFHRMFVE